jgi:hypothetical protein
MNDLSWLSSDPTFFPRRGFLACLPGCILAACRQRNLAQVQSISFTRIPQADASGREKNEIIEGRANGAGPDEKVVLYARNEKWWIQPLADHPFTPVGSDGKWTNATHLGTDYAAVLVKPNYNPPLSANQLPAVGGDVLAVAAVKGAASPPSTYLNFSGYEWRVRNAPSSRGGNNPYDPKNAWTDGDGVLHMRISKSSGRWTCAEISCTRSLGYGTYTFVVRDTSHMEPSAVLDFFTYDYSAADANYHEMNLEVSRWGDPASQNAQYIVQPWYQAANVIRFSAPAGALRYSMKWERGRVLFQTVSRAVSGETRLISQKLFTVGIPEPGIESIRVALYAFLKGKVPLRNDTEVLIEKFEYLP